MHRFNFILSFILSTFLLMINLANASPTNPTNGAEYITLSSPQPVSAPGNKIEVIEFFMYHCPACYALEPVLSEWVKKQGDNIVFKRIHFLGKGANDAEAHLFLALDSMQMEGALRDKLFAAWHVERVKFVNDDDYINWAVKNGIDKEKLTEAYHSFAVRSRLEGLPRVAESYQTNSTPTIIINGRYLTSMALVFASNKNIPRDMIPKATMQVVDALVVKARASK